MLFDDDDDDDDDAADDGDDDDDIIIGNTRWLWAIFSDMEDMESNM